MMTSADVSTRSRRQRLLLGAPTVALAAALLALGSDVPVLRVSATPQQAFAPLKLTVRVRQVPDELRGREVCLVVRGEEDVQSCWQQDNPAALVVREFTLVVSGSYEVQAFAANGRGGVWRSNVVAVNVVAANERRKQ